MAYVTTLNLKGGRRPAIVEIAKFAQASNDDAWADFALGLRTKRRSQTRRWGEARGTYPGAAREIARAQWELRA